MHIAGVSVVIPTSMSAAAATQQNPDSTAAAEAAAEPSHDNDSQPLTLTSWMDVDTLQQSLANSGVALTAEDFVSLSAVLKPGLSVDDMYDAHPAMLPLVRLIEKAMTLPSDVQV